MVLDTYPLSALQQGMLFHTLLGARSGVDIQQLLIEFHEPLDVAVFRRAWTFVMARHAILRTDFRWKDVKQPQQQVHAQLDLPWEEEDWRGLSDVERNQRFSDFLRTDGCRAFDMSEAPLFRLAFFHYGEGETRLVWTVHHALLDGRSLATVAREVFALYEAFHQGEEATLPELQPYREHIEWLQQQNFGNAEAFWRHTLSGFATPTPLVVHHLVHTGVDKTRRGAVEALLSSEVTTALQTFARVNQITLTSLLHAAWAILLSRYSDETDVVFGVVRACRSGTAGAAAMVGLFSNTLPLRARVDPDAPLLPWLKQLHGQWNMMRKYEHTPLGKVQAWCQVPAGTPLFDSIVMFDNFDLDTVFRPQSGRWSSIKVTLHGQSIYPVNLLAYGGAELRLQIAFDRSRFDHGTVGRMMNHLRALLEDIATNPRRKLQEFPLLTSAERSQLLREWNNTEAVYPQDVCLHELFERQVERTPDAIAVVFDEERWTYRDLNHRANQVAQHLRELHIGPGALVCIYLQRSWQLVASLLGTLKVGAAYVPIDPTYPADRVRFMLDDTNAPAVLTQVGLVGMLSPLVAPRAICVDRLGPITAVAMTDLPCTVTDENLAYVMYTSGSTGTPKGVMVSHRAIVNNIQWMRSTFPIDQRDRVLQKTAISFDPAVWEIFLPLSVGAQLIIPRPDGHKNLEYLVQLIVQNQVTILNCIPSFLAALLETPEFGSCRSLRHCFCGGEIMPEDLVRRFYSTHPAELHNLYGPTEASITSLFYSVPRRDAPRIIPIGRPVANTLAYVLSRDRKLMPIGVVGELYLGGRQLAEGYYKRPELTIDCFVADCFSGLENARLYRTGDKARLLPDGNIEFLGRIDQQVKFRGFRIELGEIEAALRRNPKVRGSAVVLHKDAAGGTRLIAYVVSATSPPSSGELRNYLKTQLPDYMVPSKILLLDALPLAPNGKIDRQALPPPEENTQSCALPYCTPRTPTEEDLADVWRRILGVQKIGIHDNFFELGGDSLMTVRLVDAINQSLSVNIGVTDIFQSPTIAQLAGVIAQPKPARRKPLVVALQDGRSEPAIYFIGSGSALARLAQLMGDGHPVFGIEVPWPPAWRHALETNETSAWPDIQQLIAPFVSAVVAHTQLSPCVLVGHSFGGLMAFEVAHQVQKRGGKVELVVLLDARVHHPGRYRVAWHKLRRKWEHSMSTQHFFLSVAPALKRLTLKGQSLIEQTAINVLLRSGWPIRRKVSNMACQDITGPPSHIADEDGVALPLLLVEKLYKRIQRSYRPARIECRGLLCLAQDAHDKDARAALDNTAGWSNLFGRGLEIVSVPGDHLSMVRAEHNMQRLSAEISNVLQRDLEAVKCEGIDTGVDEL